MVGVGVSVRVRVGVRVSVRIRTSKAIGSWVTKDHEYCLVPNKR